MATWLPFVAWNMFKSFQCCSKLVAYIAEDFIVRTGPGLLRGAHLKELIQKSTQATPHSFNMGQPLCTTKLIFHCKALSIYTVDQTSRQITSFLFAANSFAFLSNYIIVLVMLNNSLKDADSAFKLLKIFSDPSLNVPASCLPGKPPAAAARPRNAPSAPPPTSSPCSTRTRSRSSRRPST